MDSSKSTEITNKELEETRNENDVNNEGKETNEVVNNEEKEIADDNTKAKSVTDSSLTIESDNPNDENGNEPEIKMDFIDKDLCYDLMSVPTLSDEEYRLVTYVILWARRNNIKYEFDDHGNIYLTKGVLSDGEYYPCVTAHLDTVQTKQKAYAQAGCRLEVKTRYNVTEKHHEIYVDGMGIGGDDKAGVLIGLSMFSHCDKLKAIFFLCEEKGCIGSNAMDISKLDDVGYVMGFDSPELNRAAYACSGVRLFSKDFYETYMEEVCKEYGLTDFRSEPFTDVKVIRDKTDIMCMNFGSGYYFCHMPNEYCVLEEMDNACKMGAALIKKIGNTRHEYSFKSSSCEWVKQADGTYKQVKDKDSEFFNKLGGVSTYYGNTYYSNRNYYDDDYDCDYDWSNWSNNNNNKTSSITKKEEEKNDNNISIETLNYIIDKYNEHIYSIKESIEDKCKSLGIDFNEFKEVFNTEIKF